MREGRGGEGEQRDLRPSKAGSPVDTLPSPVAQPRCAAPHPKPPYCCGVLGVLRAQLCLCRKRAANRAPEQEPGQSAVLHQHAPGGASSSITEHPPNAVCLSSPAQRLDGDHPAQARQLEEPGGGLAPSSQELFPLPTRPGAPAKRGHSRASPRHALGDPLAFPPGGSRDAGAPVPPTEPLLTPSVAQYRAGREYFCLTGVGGSAQGEAPRPSPTALRPASAQACSPHPLSTQQAFHSCCTPTACLLSSFATPCSPPLAPAASQAALPAQAASPGQARLLLFPLPLCLFLFPISCFPPFSSPRTPLLVSESLPHATPPHQPPITHVPAQIPCCTVRFLLAGSHQDPTGELQPQHGPCSPQVQV